LVHKNTYNDLVTTWHIINYTPLHAFLGTLICIAGTDLLLGNKRSEVA